ncbi:MAG: hypothetical protein ACLT3Y_04860 [Ruminococcus callidus]
MELKEILSHAEAVQFLLYSIQHGKQTRTALKKALPEDVPTDALLDAMTDFGFLCGTESNSDSTRNAWNSYGSFYSFTQRYRTRPLNRISPIF